jgi:hypothetical protein
MERRLHNRTLDLERLLEQPPRNRARALWQQRMDAMCIDTLMSNTVDILWAECGRFVP